MTEPEVEALEHPRRVREVLRIAVEVVEEQKPVPRVHLLAEVAGPVDMGEGHRADAVAGVGVRHREGRAQRERHRHEAYEPQSLPDVSEHEEAGQEPPR